MSALQFPPDIVGWLTSEIEGAVMPPTRRQKLREAADAIEELVEALEAAQQVIDYAAERLWNDRPDAIQARPTSIDVALRQIRAVLAKHGGEA